MALAPATAAPTAPDFADMQGLVRFGHGHLGASRFLLLRVLDAAAARAWLARLELTTAERVTPRPDAAVQVALSAPGLVALGLDAALVGEFSAEFVGGMSGDAARSRRLGDVADNDPAGWRWGRAGGEPHVLLLLYAREPAIDALETRLRDAAFARGFSVTDRLPTDALRATEAFGFADGVSQPAIDWARRVDADPHGPPRYTNRLAPGEVVLGYPDEYGMRAPRPLPGRDRHPGAAELPAAPEDAARGDLGRNGSYLVLRQISQDVAGFWRFVDRAAGGSDAGREALAAAMIGRSRDGAPLVTPAGREIDGIAGANRREHFDYDADPYGHACPIGAHARRANPRTGDYPDDVRGPLSRLRRILGFGSRHVADDIVSAARFHRLLRRGRGYGDTPSVERALADDAPAGPERGLQFLCLCGSLSRQFEFVQGAWLSGPSFGGLEAEADPLLGHRVPLAGGRRTDVFTRPRAEGVADRVEGLPSFTRVVGGAYFFLPGVRALRFIAAAGRAGERRAEEHGAEEHRADERRDQEPGR